MTNERVEVDMYDRGIVPAETAARKEREGDAYKHLPEKDRDVGLDTTGGYTVDKEGLLNNYAIEPEMYYEVPGDAAEVIEAETRERAAELEEINDNEEQGKLTSGRDERGKGVGMI